MTACSVLAKLWAIFQLKQCKGNRTALQNVLFIFVLLLLGQSVCELALYYYANAPASAGARLSLVGYYCFTFAAVATLPFVALKAAARPLPLVSILMAIPVYVAIVILLLFTRIIIAGVELNPHSHSLTKIAGDDYWLFQVATLTVVLFAACTFLKHALKDRDYFIRTRCRNLSIAFIPVISFAFIIVFLMQLGFRINAVGILPVCLAIYVAALIHNMQEDVIPDYLAYIPGTQKNKLKKIKTKDLTEVSRLNQKNHDGIYQDLVISYYLNIFNGNQSEVARYLGISQATVSRRKNRQ